MPDLDRQALGLGCKPALVVVDVIRGFTAPACPLGSESTEVVAAIVKLLSSFRAAGLPVFFSTVVYSNADQASVFRNRLPALNVLQPGSKWIEIDPRLGRRPEEPVIEKHWASAFFKTSLAECLADRSVDSLVVVGLTTSGCVRATAVDGLQYNYRVVVPREATGDRNPDAHEANLFDLHAKYADVTGLQDVLDHVTHLSDRRETGSGISGISASL